MAGTTKKTPARKSAAKTTTKAVAEDGREARHPARALGPQRG